MASDLPSEIRKRILFLSLALGVMAGVGAYVVVKAVQQERFALIAVLLPLALTAVPLGRALARLRRGELPAD